MDEPHDTQTYYTPTQLVYVADGDLRLLIYKYTLTQMTAKAGIRKHGKAAEAALMTEFAQLEDLSVYEPVAPASLTKQQRKAALRAINLIKAKRDGRLKGRTVADGRAQMKSETSSPTVATDALMLSIVVDAHEGRDVATADVAGAYLKANMDDFVLLKFTGESVDILCKMNKKYAKYVTKEGNVKVLYARLAKALYGCVKSAMLWYQLFTESLQQMGFVLNPYDPCIANCMIEGSQCTVAWYVDDNKISHANPDVVTAIIEKIEEKFNKMTVIHGR